MGIYVVARLVDLPQYRLWFDEIYSMQAIHRGWVDVIRFIRDYDPHPPAWYLLFKAWVTVGGESYMWLGLFPALFAIATLVPTFLLARALRLRPAAVNVALAMMAANGYLVGSAQELRMYTMLGLLAATSAWLLAEYVATTGSGIRTLAALTAVNGAMVFTQYYGWLPIGAEGLILLALDRRKALAFTATTCVVVALYLPWVWVVAHAAVRRVAAGEEAIAFTARPTLFSVALFYSVLDGALAISRATILSTALFLLPVLLWLAGGVAGGRTARDGRTARVVLPLLAFAPALVAALASLALPFSVWGQRHLITVAVPYALLVGTALDAVRPTVARTAWLAACVVWFGAASVQAWETPYKVPGWDRLVARMTETDPTTGGSPVPVYALNSSAAYDAQFYLDRAGERRFRTVVVKPATERGRMSYGPGSQKPYWALISPVLLVDQLSSLPSGHFWCADDGGDDGDAASAWGGGSARTLLSQAGFVVGSPFTADVVIRRWNTRRVELFPAWRAGASGQSR